jgi:RNA polymerase sigma factor (TIGR02999 family)
VAPTISGLILSADGGDRTAADTLFAALYGELHDLARRQLSRGPRATLGTTTLLHEAYLNISGREGTHFPDRARFMGYAAKVMRGLIIDYARRRQALKRGGGFELTAMEDVAAPADADELVQIGQALDQLGEADPPLAELVDLRFFGGFSLPEIAAMRGVTERTTQRHWDKARAYLHRAIHRSL